MPFETILYERDGKIVTITLNRPHVLNAMNPQLFRELAAALETLSTDRKARIGIVTGQGRAFCAGADLKEGSKEKNLSALELREAYLQTNQRITYLLRHMSIPVIAAVNGYAVGGGCELALACDLVIASEQAKFGFPEAGVGRFVTGGITQILPQLVGLAKAKELIFTCRMVEGKEAAEIGLVNSVVPHHELMSTVKELAENILDKAPLSIAFAKTLLNKGTETSLDAMLSYEVEASLAVHLAQEDMAEGARAFQEKRKPIFTGR